MQQQQLKQRLRQLREEYAAGEKRLAKLEAQQAERAQRAELRKTLFRIGAAIQVLEDLSEKDAAPDQTPD